MEISRLIFLLWIVGLLGLGGNGSVLALDPAEVFRRVSPSVVKFSNAEGEGSGIVLTADGLILTNYHVVNSPLPLKVSARVSPVGGQPETRVFENVTVSKVHPRYDLALVKIEDDGVRFAPSKLISRSTPVQTGETCFAIGNPDGGNVGSLDLTITDGLVSSVSRKIEGLEYFQIGASVNPGNSGGAVCNNQGEVIGVVTFKLEGAEGIGFAIPTQQLRMNDFVAPSERKGDPEKAREYEAKGHELLNRAELVVDPDEKEYLTYLGLLLFRLALTENPNDPSLHFNTAICYSRFLLDEVGEAFLKSAVRVENHYSPARHILGNLEAERGNFEAAISHWKAGVLDPDEKRAESRAACLAKWASQEKIPARSAYLVRWANSINTPAGESALARRQLERNALASVGAEQRQFLEKKNDSYSLEELESFAAGAPAGGNQMKTPETGPADVGAPDVSPGPAIVQRILVNQVRENLLVTKEVTAAGSGGEWVVEDGPEGIELEGSTLKWKVPARFPGESAKVLLSRGTEGGARSYRVETLEVAR